MELLKQKQCNKCYELKPLSEFYKHPATKDKHCYMCKNCHKIYGKNYITLNKKTEKYKKRKREYIKKWRKENLIKARMHSRKANEKYIALNPEKIKEWKKANVEKIRIYMKGWRQTPKGKINEIKKAYKKRVLLKNCTINNLTSNQIQILLTKAKQCAICNKVFNKKRKKTLDHIVPLAQGGNNTWLNIQVTCMGCNCRKSARDYTEFNGGQILMFI